MKRFAINFAIAAALVGIGYYIVYYTPLIFPPLEKQAGWEKDLPTALARAKEEDKLVLVDIYASWCPNCRQMEKETFPDPAVQAALEDFVLVGLEYDDHKDVAEKYSGGVFPASVVLKPDGESVSHVLGFKPADEYVAFLEEAKKAGAGAE